MESLRDKVAVVTGGGSGIGRQVSLDLAGYGAKVVLSDINTEAAQQTANLITSLYPSAQALAVKCDVSSSESVASMIERAVERFGRIDLAVNNAGLLGPLATPVEYPEEIFDQLVKVNLKGVFLCLKHEIAQFLKQGKGSYAIVNLSSIAGKRGFVRSLPYVATKHGVTGMTKSAALDYAKSGIRINAVCPSPIDTAMYHNQVASGSALAKILKTANPMGRLGTPEEVSAAILWLLSDASSFTTGKSISVDGGQSAL
eukprot:Phypoly_transcript_13279.p1 GENE.Phypoly_transcript_13279~~Phypoly_transcript_13279.p1  ORF type:complete len:287 (+),score=36.08 Phypoly_transcript_13279:92-862(+)